MAGRGDPPAEGEYPVNPEPSNRPPNGGLPGDVEPNHQDEPPPGNPFQFSLGELLLLLVLSAVALGSLQLLPAEAAAGLAGLIALVSLALLLTIPMPRPGLILAWWIILAIYVVTAAVALVRP